MRARSLASWALSLVMVAVGLGLIASFFLAGRLDSTATNGDDPGGFNVPKLETTDDGSTTGAEGPKDKTLELTVPAMARIENDEIPTAVGTDEQALKTHAAIHLEGTGFPWQREANVYIAGHRLGYPRTKSFLVFQTTSPASCTIDAVVIAASTMALKLLPLLVAALVAHAVSGWVEHLPPHGLAAARDDEPVRDPSSVPCWTACNGRI